MNTRNILLSLLLPLFLTAIPANAEKIAAGFSPVPDQEDGWVLLPEARPFPTLAPDPYGIKTALRKNSRQELEAEVGSYRSIAGWKGMASGEDTVFHTGIEGKGFFEMRTEGSKFPLQSTDGFIGVYAEAARGLNQYQFSFTHLSAHLSDGIFLVRQRIDYSREYAQLRFAHQFGWTRAYIGYQFLAHTIPVLPKSSGEIGFYSIAPIHWRALHPFIGADLRVRDAEEGTIYNLTTGIAIVSSQGTPPVRISANYLHGHDIRGQFYTDKMSKFSVGLELDL